MPTFRTYIAMTAGFVVFLVCWYGLPIALNLLMAETEKLALRNLILIFSIEFGIMGFAISRGKREPPKLQPSEVPQDGTAPRLDEIPDLPGMGVMNRKSSLKVRDEALGKVELGIGNPAPIFRPTMGNGPGSRPSIAETDALQKKVEELGKRADSMQDALEKYQAALSDAEKRASLAEQQLNDFKKKASVLLSTTEPIQA